MNIQFIRKISCKLKNLNYYLLKNPKRLKHIITPRLPLISKNILHFSGSSLKQLVVNGNPETPLQGSHVAHILHRYACHLVS